MRRTDGNCRSFFPIHSRLEDSMDEDDRGGFGASMFMIQALGAPLLMTAIFLMLLLPGFLYVIGRWRAGKNGQSDDPQFGFKFALNVFGWAGFQYALFALVALFYAVLSDIPSDFKSPIYRAVLALMIPSLIVLAIHRSVYNKTNHRAFPNVHRLFVGYNLIFFGSIAFVAFILLFQGMFMKGSSGELGKIAGSMFAVFGGAWVFLAVTMARLSGVSGGSQGDIGGSAGGYPPYPTGQQQGYPPAQQPGQYGAAQQPSQPYGSPYPAAYPEPGATPSPTPVATTPNPYAPPGYDPNKP
jgi:hypothetical protein